ncbi:MAG: HipA N-terminal domain-containing protein [Ignavibacteria bacterium]|nr:HipA N-terminal domain-containing protein [Ignavibacteria bacterium]
MNRKGKVFFKNNYAGIISEDESGYSFVYDEEYIANNFPPISLTLPLIDKNFFSKTMFPFFDGLIPEGWLLKIAQENWKLNPKDRIGLLLSVCKDCIGAVSVVPIEESDNE